MFLYIGSILRQDASKRTSSLWWKSTIKLTKKDLTFRRYFGFGLYIKKTFLYLKRWDRFTHHDNLFHIKMNQTLIKINIIPTKCVECCLFSRLITKTCLQKEKKKKKDKRWWPVYEQRASIVFWRSEKNRKALYVSCLRSLTNKRK